MRYPILVTVVLLILVAGSALPAGAQMPIQHTFTLRYWGSALNFSNPNTGTGVAFSYNHPGWGLSYRGDAQTQPWSFSANYDRLNNTGQFWETASMWNANVHYRLGSAPNALFSVFVGYGSMRLSESTGGQQITGSGFRLGADARFNFPSQQMTGWYVTGEAAYGPSWSSSSPVLSLTSGNTVDYKVALGREFPNGFAAQVGWRSLTWNIGTSPACFDPGCRWRWSGWTLELLMRR